MGAAMSGDLDFPITPTVSYDFGLAKPNNRLLVAYFDSFFLASD